MSGETTLSPAPDQKTSALYVPPVDAGRLQRVTVDPNGTTARSVRNEYFNDFRHRIRGPVAHGIAASDIRNACVFGDPDTNATPTGLQPHSDTDRPLDSDSDQWAGLFLPGVTVQTDASGEKQVLRRQRNSILLRKYRRAFVSDFDQSISFT